MPTVAAVSTFMKYFGVSGEADSPSTEGAVVVATGILGVGALCAAAGQSPF